MKICSVVGTRPNFVKEYLLNRELKCRGVDEKLIHTVRGVGFMLKQGEP